MAKSPKSKSRRPVAVDTPFRTIGEAFYQLRAKRGREWTAKRFAAELGVEAAFLGYVERGLRFPSEDLVRRLASICEVDPRPLLTILARDRMVRALEREIRRILEGAEAGEASDGPVVGPSETKILARALSALPHEGAVTPLKDFRARVRDLLVDEGAKGTAAEVNRVLQLLRAKGLMEADEAGVRKTGRHLQVTDPSERIALAVEFATIFAKGLADKLVAERADTYVRNHFVAMPRAKAAAFRERLDRVLKDLVDEFAAEEGDVDEFVRVLVTATTKE